MSHESISIEELATRMGRDRRDVEKLANRGRIPGRKVAGAWQFHPTEIRHWLEHEMRAYTDTELAALEEGQRTEATEEDTPILHRMALETVQVPLQGRTKRSGDREPGRGGGPHVANLGTGHRASRRSGTRRDFFDRIRERRRHSPSAKSAPRCVGPIDCRVWPHALRHSVRRTRGGSSAICFFLSCVATRVRTCTFWLGWAG